VLAKASDGLLGVLDSGAAKKHAEECASGANNYPVRYTCDAGGFSDDDFSTIVLPEEFAGPDAQSLQGGSAVHITKQPLLSGGEIEALVAEAAAAMANGQRANFTYAERENLDEVHVSTLPAARGWLTRRLGDTFLPMLADRYGLDARSLRVFDALVIR